MSSTGKARSCCRRRPVRLPHARTGGLVVGRLTSPPSAKLLSDGAAAPAAALGVPPPHWQGARVRLFHQPLGPAARGACHHGSRRPERGHLEADPVGQRTQQRTRCGMHAVGGRHHGPRRLGGGVHAAEELDHLGSVDGVCAWPGLRREEALGLDLRPSSVRAEAGHGDTRRKTGETTGGGEGGGETEVGRRRGGPHGSIVGCVIRRRSGFDHSKQLVAT